MTTGLAVTKGAAEEEARGAAMTTGLATTGAAEETAGEDWNGGEPVGREGPVGRRTEEEVVEEVEGRMAEGM